LKLKAEVSRLNGEVGSLKNTESKLRSEVSRLNGEVGSLKNAKSG
jgi:predicted  nucleic acid-binding Zn-ribbon protein